VKKDKEISIENTLNTSPTNSHTKSPKEKGLASLLQKVQPGPNMIYNTEDTKVQLKRNETAPFPSKFLFIRIIEFEAKPNLSTTKSNSNANLESFKGTRKNTVSDISTPGIGQDSKEYNESGTSTPLMMKSNKNTRSVSFASVYESNKVSFVVEMPHGVNKVKTTKKKSILKEETKTNSQAKSSKASPNKTTTGNPNIKSRKSSPNKAPKVEIFSLLKPSTKKTK